MFLSPFSSKVFPHLLRWGISLWGFYKAQNVEPLLLTLSLSHSLTLSHSHDILLLPGYQMINTFIVVMDHLIHFRF